MRRRREIYSCFGMMLPRSEPTRSATPCLSAPVTILEATAAASPTSRTHLHLLAKASPAKRLLRPQTLTEGFQPPLACSPAAYACAQSVCIHPALTLACLCHPVSAGLDAGCIGIEIVVRPSGLSVRRVAVRVGNMPTMPPEARTESAPDRASRSHGLSPYLRNNNLPYTFLLLTLNRSGCRPCSASKVPKGTPRHSAVVPQLINSI